MTTLTMRVAPAARQALPTRLVATPLKPVAYTDKYTGREVLRPDRDYIVPDHPLVRANPSMFRIVHHWGTPKSLEQRQIEAELRQIQAAKRALIARDRGRLQHNHRERAHAPWHLTTTTRAEDWRLG